MNRHHELARLAWGKINALGHDPVVAITEAIQAALREHIGVGSPVTADRRCRGMVWALAVLRRHQLPMTPADVGLRMGTSPKVAWAYLQRLLVRRLVRRVEGGRYSPVGRMAAPSEVDP